MKKIMKERPAHSFFINLENLIWASFGPNTSKQSPPPPPTPKKAISANFKTLCYCNVIQIKKKKRKTKVPCIDI